MSLKRLRDDDEYVDREPASRPAKKSRNSSAVPAPARPPAPPQAPINVVAAIKKLFPAKARLVDLIHSRVAPQNGGSPQPILLRNDWVERDIRHHRDVVLWPTKWYGFGTGTLREPRVETDVLVPGHTRCQCGNDKAFKQFFFMDIESAVVLTAAQLARQPKETSCEVCHPNKKAKVARARQQ